MPDVPAKLPDWAHRRRRVRDLRNGEVAWVTPWSVHLDVDGGCWLDEEATIHPRQGGTVSARVTRHGAGVHLAVDPLYFTPTDGARLTMLPVLSIEKHGESTRG